MKIHDLIQIMETFPCLRPYIKSRLSGPHVKTLHFRDLNDWAMDKCNQQTVQAARLAIILWNAREAAACGYHFNLIWAMRSFDEEHKNAFLHVVIGLSEAKWEQPQT